MSKFLADVSHIIFDWDGTLMDSAAKIVACMQQAATLSNLPVPTKPQVEHIIGISLIPAIQQLFNVSLEKATEVSLHYKEVFLMRDTTACSLFENTHSTLEYLSSNYVLGVATGKARRGLNRAFASSRSEHYFNASICADEAESKPSPDMLIKLLKQWNIEPKNAVMIGDTKYDMQMAEAIGMPRIAVSYGVHSEELLIAHKPHFIIKEVNELKSIFG